MEFKHTPPTAYSSSKDCCSSILGEEVVQLEAPTENLKKVPTSVSGCGSGNAVHYVWSVSEVFEGVQYSKKTKVYDLKTQLLNCKKK